MKIPFSKSWLGLYIPGCCYKIEIFQTTSDLAGKIIDLFWSVFCCCCDYTDCLVSEWANHFLVL